MAERKRDYRAEYRRRVERARSRGFESPYQETRYRRTARTEPVSSIDFVKRSNLRKLGITEARLEEMRLANRAHTPEGVRKDGKPGSKLAQQIQRYNTAIDEKEGDFSIARLGYIKAFYDAVVNPETNFWSGRPDRNSFIESNVNRKSARYLKWIRAQYEYLIRFGGFMDTEEFDDRYAS